MKVYLKFFLNYQEKCGREEDIMVFSEEKINLEKVYFNLSENYDLDIEKINKQGIIMVNDKAVNNLEPENVEIKDGDKIVLMPMVSGG